MHRFYADPDRSTPDVIVLTPEDARHALTVLRLKPGHHIEAVLNHSRMEAVIEQTDKQEVIARRISLLPSTEPSLSVTLFQGLPKADKMDLIVQKAVELGVTEIIPVQMRRSVVKLEGAKIAKRTQRWQTIAEAAAKQSRRAVVPVVHEPMTMDQAVQFASVNSEVRLLPYELQEEDGSTREIMESIRSGSGVSVFIGPEGGFEPGEVELARQAGIMPISLGKRILRTETAALVVLSWLIYLLEIS